MEMHFATVWESIADVMPDRTALVHGDTRRTWHEFDDRSARLAAAFATTGLASASRCLATIRKLATTRKLAATRRFARRGRVSR